MIILEYRNILLLKYQHENHTWTIMMYVWYVWTKKKKKEKKKMNLVLEENNVFWQGELNRYWKLSFYNDENKNNSLIYVSMKMIMVIKTIGAHWTKTLKPLSAVV